MTVEYRIRKFRRIHLDSIAHDSSGRFKHTGGAGSQGGPEPGSQAFKDHYTPGRKPKHHDDDRDDDKKDKGKGKGGHKVGAIHWFSKTESMHKPVPKKPRKTTYVTSHSRSSRSKG